MSSIVRILGNGANVAGEIELVDTQLMAACGADDNSDPQVMIEDHSSQISSQIGPQNGFPSGPHQFAFFKGERELFFADEKFEKVKSGL
jgi:hypothetical protein